MVGPLCPMRFDEGSLGCSHPRLLLYFFDIKNIIELFAMLYIVAPASVGQSGETQTEQ